MNQPGLLPVEHETNSTTTRRTRDGRLLKYSLSVLQQPERARACGAGAKSSADRRPVDPPPIVELKITEPDNDDRDVTSSMNASYFLFATLEQARNIHPGRVGEDKQQRLTVLTGTPVAGMVYLERPQPAGYFIFQDLSVRHEGRYRLCFNLYEELKEPRDSTYDDGRQGSPDDAHVTHRMDVKSSPFVVYSAKRFPGLTSSTSLSRTVAEQGCRVRIRRDVRMRRPRDAKGGKDWDGYEDETAEARGRVSATPEAPPLHNSIILPAPPPYTAEATGRPRSSSNASHRTLPDPLSRRTSLQEMNHAYNQPYGSGPNTPQQCFGHFGSAPRDQYTAPYMQQPPIPPPQFPAVSHPPPQYHGYGGNPMPAPPPPPQYPAPSQYMPADQRRSSSQYSTANTYAQPRPVPPPMQPAYSAAQDPWSHAPMHRPSIEYKAPAPAAWSSMPQLPPVSVPTMHPKPENAPTSISTLEPYQTKPITSDLQPSEPQPINPSESYKSADVFQPSTASKRSLTEAFHYGADGPSKQGARPSENPNPYARSNSAFLTSQQHLESDDYVAGSALDSVSDLQYRRSTGATSTRSAYHPPPQSGSGHY